MSAARTLVERLREAADWGFESAPVTGFYHFTPEQVAAGREAMREADACNDHFNLNSYATNFAAGCKDCWQAMLDAFIQGAQLMSADTVQDRESQIRDEAMAAYNAAFDAACEQHGAVRAYECAEQKRAAVYERELWAALTQLATAERQIRDLRAALLAARPYIAAPPRINEFAERTAELQQRVDDLLLAPLTAPASQGGNDG